MGGLVYTNGKPHVYTAKSSIAGQQVILASDSGNKATD